MTQPQNQPQPMDDANEFLMSGGMKSIGWKDNPVGYTVIGTIVDQPKRQQMTKYESTELAFWPSGDPMIEIVCTIQTEMRDPADAYDNGRRRLHIPPRMQPVIRDAVKRTGARGLGPGGRIAVKRTGGTGTAGSPFEFAAEYAAPVVDPDSMLGGNGNGAQAAPQQQAPMLGTPATHPTPAAAAPVNATLGSMLAGPAGGDEPPPPGIAPERWAALDAVQRQAVKAAMGIPF